MEDMAELQTPEAVFLVRPKNFGFNPATAITNHFQDNSKAFCGAKVLEEFEAVVKQLECNGIETVVFDDLDSPACPDAIFPNNWISLHRTGDLILYPMHTENRRTERRVDIIDQLNAKYSFKRTIDLSWHEMAGRALEGTGSVVFDYQHRVAYACLSERTNESVLDDLCDQLGYTKCVFTALDEQSRPVYHTNVVISICTQFVLASSSALQTNPQLRTQLESTKRRIHELSDSQINNFAANCLEVKDKNGRRHLVISTRGWASLCPDQQKEISESCHGIILANVETIEDVGGGGVRCMLAGIYL